MSVAERIIARLDGVRAVGAGRWVARCPAHDDRNPSLSIREADGDRVLIHDFAGCSAIDVLSAIGLELSDLYPDRPADHRARPAKPNHWHAAREALRTLNLEVLIVAIAAERVADGAVLDDNDRDRLVLAASRIRDAAEVVA